MATRLIKEAKDSKFEMDPGGQSGGTLDQNLNSEISLAEAAQE